MKRNSKIYVAGHNGLLGSAIVRRLHYLGYENLLTADRQQLDLSNQQAVDFWFENKKPEYVFLAAAHVFGIGSNVSGEAILNNLRIELNVIDAARRNQVKKLLFPGSNCAYPKFCQLPITEDQLLTGKLEPTSEGYAIAKIAGIKLCEHFKNQWGFNSVVAMPCNLYGPNDSFDLDRAHVMPAMINKFVTAKRNNSPSITLWGDGSARREFLYVDDAADACILCMLEYNDILPINLASNEELSLSELAAKIKSFVGYQGAIHWDNTKPVGTWAKTLDTTKLSKLGWHPKISLDIGIPATIDWFEKRTLTC